MKTLVLTNRKGGVGKTTLAVHAAWYFAETKRVLFLELDPQRNGSGTLRDHLCDIPLSRMMMEDVELPTIDGPGIIAVAADDEVNNLAHRQDGPVQQFIKNVRRVSDHFDVCIMDTSPATNFLNLGALMVATHALAPLAMTQYSTDGIKALLQQIFGVQKQFNKDLEFLGLLPNAYMPNQPSQKRALQELFAAFGDKYMFKGMLGVRQAFADATAGRVPAWKIDGTSARDAGKDIRAILKQIDDTMHAEAA